MTLENRAKADNEIMSILKLQEIRHLLCATTKGNLSLMLRKGEDASGYRFVLDSVPYDEKTTKELMPLFEGILWDKEMAETITVGNIADKFLGIEENVNPTTGNTEPTSEEKERDSSPEKGGSPGSGGTTE